MSTQTLTDIELILLGIIAEGTRFAAELDRTLDQRGLRHWLTMGASSLHYVLRRLESQHLIVSHTTADQPTYGITEAGRGVLHTAVTDLIGQRRPLGGLALGLANLHVLKPSQAWQALQRRHADLKVALERLRLHDETASPSPARGMPDPLFTYQITLMEAELAWLTGFMTTWRSQHPALRETDETQPITPVDGHGEVTLIHRRTDPPRHKRIQAVRPIRPADE